MSADGMIPGAGFEGGWMAEGLADDARLECGVCWRVYDPKDGDPSRAIEAGTPFRALPENWRCPECDSEKAKFMVVDAGVGPKRGPEAASMQTRLDALLNAYRDADLAMAGLPIYNDQLRLAALGFRPYQDGYVGALVSPWFLNLVVLPAEKRIDPRASGAERALVFPSGAYGFANVTLEGVGSFEFCSLFSPVLEFENQAAARLAAETAMEELMRPAPPPVEKPTKPAPQEPEPNRRTLLMGRRKHSADAEPA